MKKRIAALLSVLAVCIALGADGVIRAVRAPSPVYLDGVLDEAAWKAAPVCASFVDTETKKAPPVKTTLRVLFDDDAVYLGVECEEPHPERMQLRNYPRDGAVFYNDSVEIMLDPGHTQETYWHFIVGATESRYDAFNDKGIGYRDAQWNGMWAARVRIGKAGWSCEVKIPFFNFARRRPLSGEWGVNVIRNRQASAKASFGVAGIFHEPTKFLRLTGLDCDFTVYQVEVASLSAQPGMNSKGQGYVESTAALVNFTGKAQNYLAENYLKGPDGEIFFAKPAKVEAAPGARTAVKFLPVTLKAPGVHTNILRVADAAGKTIAFREVKTEIGFSPVALKMLDPHYRYTIFATQKLETIAFDVQLKLPEAQRKDKTLAIAIGASGQAPVWEKRFPAPGETTAVRIPNAGIPEGRYAVTARLLDAKGAPMKFAEASCPLWKVPFKPGETWLSKDGRVMREGKPMFTVSTRYGWMPDVPAANAMTTMGVSRVRPDQLWLSGDIIWRVGGQRIPEFRKAMQTGAFTEKQFDMVRGLVRQFRDEPRLYAWLWFDEPSSDSLLPEALEALYKVVKEEDPWHPVWGSDSPTHKYLRSLDVHEHHPYPAVRGARTVINDCTPIAHVADAIRHSQANEYQKTALAFCDMGINKWDWGLGFRDSRIPTMLEFHNQCFMAICIGCNHLCVYGNDSYCYPEVSYGWLALVPEFRYVGEHAVQERHPVQPSVSGAKDVRRIATDTADGYFLVASNVSMETCQVVFSGLPKQLTQLHVVGEKRVVAVKDGVMRDEFLPCAGRAYVEKAPPSFPGLPEVAAKVEELYRERAKPGNLLWQRGRDETVVIDASTAIVNYSNGGKDTALWHLCDGAVPATSGGYGLLQWTSHPDDRKPWVEFTPKRRPFALGRVVIDALDRSLGRFHIEVFADGAWKTVFTCADGTKDNHFECAFPPVSNAERFRIVVDEPVGKLGRMRNFPRLENIKVARIGEVEAYAK